MTAQTHRVNTAEPWFLTRGVVLTWNDVTSYDWVQLASSADLTTISVHTHDHVWSTPEAQKFLRRCTESGIVVEQEQHALNRLLPRELIEQDPALFRQDESGNRVADANCCASSSIALDIVAENAVAEAEKQPGTSDRFYFWPEDGGGWCHCGPCAELTPSDQALLVENHIAQHLRRHLPGAQLSHLAYQDTVAAPTQVVPGEGVFLEFAPFFRTWEVPLSVQEANSETWRREVPDRSSARAARRDNLRVSHGDYLRKLDENLAVFDRSTAQVLEYWLDVSLFSDWKLPAVELPWADGVLEEDLEIYASRGIRHVTTFAAYMDADYMGRFDEGDRVRHYGRALRGLRPR